MSMTMPAGTTSSTSSKPAALPGSENCHPGWDVDMSKQDIIAIYYAILNSIASPKCLMGHLSDDISMTMPICGDISGKDAVMQAISDWIETFAPYKITAALVPENALSFCETSVWWSNGVHKKTFHDLAPTSKRICIHGGTEFIFDKDDKLVHVHVHFDGNELMRQLTDEKTPTA
jgi:hypothetical protein